jgi:hypothetical protein
VLFVDPDIERLLGGPSRLTHDDIVAHPRMAEARRVYLDRFLEVYGDDPFLVRLLIESGRFLVFHLAVVLEAAQDPARRETWLTVGRLKQAVASFIPQSASGRHIDQLIGRLRAVGYLDLRPSEHDRRVRILSPTEKLWAHDRDWLVAHYAPLAFLFPEHDYGLVMGRDRAFQAVLRAAAVPFMAFGARALALEAELTRLFFERAAGFLVIAAVMQAAMASDDYPRAAVPYAAIGQRLGVSRTHVRKMLVAAEELGFVKLHARGGQRVEPLPKLWSSYDRCLAAGMMLHDMLYIAAMRAQAGLWDYRGWTRGAPPT